MIDEELCQLVHPSEYVLPGWGCCKCRTYNGLQRQECKRCGHKPCIHLPKPEEYGLCNICGVPLDGSRYKTLEGKPVQHIGHIVQEESKQKQ